MTKTVPPVPEDNQSHKGPGSAPNVPLDTTKGHRDDEKNNIREQAEHGDMTQNTSNRRWGEGGVARETSSLRTPGPITTAEVLRRRFHTALSRCARYGSSRSQVDNDVRAPRFDFKRRTRAGDPEP